MMTTSFLVRQPSTEAWKDDTPCWGNSENNDLALDSKEQTTDRDHKTDLDNEKLIKLQSDLVLLKQEIKAKEEMLSLKDELISELRDRVELMKKLADEKGS